jgi:hypothetical protein
MCVDHLFDFSSGSVDHWLDYVPENPSEINEFQDR